MHNLHIILIAALILAIGLTLFFVYKHQEDSKTKEKYTGSPCCSTCACGTQLRSSNSCSIKQPETPEILYAVSPQALSGTLFNPIQQPEYTPLIQGTITLPVQKLYTH
jgi:hypothetical protein